MSGGVFLLGDDGQLLKLVEQPYESEALLQVLLAEYPELLPGDQVNPAAPCRWLLIDREAGIPKEVGGGSNWSMDHLFLDQEGVPTFVEVKRGSDTRIRREVVGQMLDYAANAVAYWPVETIQAKFAARCEKTQKDPADELATFLQDAANEDEFWSVVKTNLQAGRVRMVFVSDEIPAELRRIVEFLNAQMDPAEVLAVEVKQYHGDHVKSLVPRVIGQTVQAQQKKSVHTGAKRPWDEDRFFTDLRANCAPEIEAVARELLAWSRKQGDVWWGRGKEAGSFSPRILHKGQKHQLFCVWSRGYLEFYFQWYAYKPPFNDCDARQRLVDRFNRIDGIKLPSDAADKRPTVHLSVLASPDVYKEVIAVFESMIVEIRAQ